MGERTAVLVLATTATKEIIDRLGPSRRQPIRRRGCRQARGDVNIATTGPGASSRPRQSFLVRKRFPRLIPGPVSPSCTACWLLPVPTDSVTRPKAHLVPLPWSLLFSLPLTYLPCGGAVTRRNNLKTGPGACRNCPPLSCAPERKKKKVGMLPTVMGLRSIIISQVREAAPLLGPAGLQYSRLRSAELALRCPPLRIRSMNVDKTSLVGGVGRARAHSFPVKRARSLASRAPNPSFCSWRKNEIELHLCTERLTFSSPRRDALLSQRICATGSVGTVPTLPPLRPPLIP